MTERLDLVVRGGHRQSLRGVAIGDALRAQPHAVDGPQRRARHLIAGVGGEQQRERSRDQKEEPQPAQCIVAPGQQLAHGHRERVRPIATHDQRSH